MVAGVYAADPETLSLAAALPRMAQLEDEHRSLLLAALKLTRGSAPRGHLHTLQGGVGTLTGRMAELLGDRLQTEAPVEGLEQRRDGAWLVHGPGGTVEADAVVLACPADVQARLVRGLDPEAAEALDAIPYAPIAVVITASPAGSWDHNPDGFGVLVAPESREGGVLGTLFTSCVFPGHVPDGEVLLRTLIGGAACPEATTMSDAQLLGWTRQHHSRFFGTERAAPIFHRIHRHDAGIPQYLPGHLGRVQVVRQAQHRLPGLFFHGNHLDGIAVKDCARASRDLAEQVRAHLELTELTA